MVYNMDHADTIDVGADGKNLQAGRAELSSVLRSALPQGSS